MTVQHTRRGVILAAGGAVGLATVGLAAGDDHEDASVVEGCDVDEAREDLESVEGDLEALREALAALQVEIGRAHAERQPPSGLPADVRQRALRTGLAARPQVVTLDITSAETDGGGTATGRFAGRTEPSFSAGSPEVTFTNVVTSIPGLKGVSGSPVFDLDGEVVAMTTGGSDVDYREFGDPVRVAPDRVFDAPISPIMASEHVGVDVTVELVERWA